MGRWSDRRRAKLERCQNLEESDVGSTVLEAEDKGGEGSIWAVAPLEREKVKTEKKIHFCFLFF